MHDLPLPAVYTYVIVLEMPDCNIRLAKAGDAVAFEELVRRHERLVLGTAIRLINGSREDAEDATQQVFLKLYRHLNSFREEENFRHWLYRITVNVCRDINKQNFARQDAPLEDRASSEIRADQKLEHNQRRQFVADALRQLPDKERAAIVLRDVQGLGTREVALILGSSEATVRSQICAGRKKLKEIVERRMR